MVSRFSAAITRTSPVNFGEIDLLFRDEQGRLNHWEVACKFYLQVDVSHVPITDYIGPNANDTLSQKATRLLKHQLPLGVRYFPEIEIREAFVKGQIFYHWQTGSRKSLPVELATDHLAGKWLRTREVPELLRDSRLRSPPNPRPAVPGPLSPGRRDAGSRSCVGCFSVGIFR